MLCDKCGNRQATVQYVQVINGDRTELHLCPDCARDMGIGTNSFNTQLSAPFNFTSIFDNMFENGNRLISNVNKEELFCPKCQTKFSDFLKNGVVGCSECYKTFSKNLDKIIKRTHGTDKYMGKKYFKESSTKKEKSVSVDATKGEETKIDKIEELTRKLKSCINEENYEDAAKIRDQIKKLKEE